MAVVQQELRKFIQKLKGKQPYINNPLYQVLKENLKSSPSIDNFRRNEVNFKNLIRFFPKIKLHFPQLAHTVTSIKK